MDHKLRTNGQSTLLQFPSKCFMDMFFVKWIVTLILTREMQEKQMKNIFIFYFCKNELVEKTVQLVGLLLIVPVALLQV